MSSNGQTIINYGGVTLYRCLTRRIEQRPVYDASGVQLKNWKFVVTGQGYLHGFPQSCKYESVAGITNPPDGATKAHTQVRWRLAPRQLFQMAMGCIDDTIASGQIILEAMPMTGVTSPTDLTTYGLTYQNSGNYIGYDVDDGPKCLQFDVVHVSGDNIFRVEFAFEINRVQCADDDTATGNKNGVLSHRWSSTDSLDENLRTTRTYRGLVEIATSQFSPHWFRDLVIPPLQEGMQREHMDFVATEDGKKLQYQITDRSVAMSAPYPARTWAIEHTEASVMQDGLKQTSQCSVKLTGAEDCNMGQLLILGLYIVKAKLNGSPPGNPPADARPFMMNDITITEFLGATKAVAVSASGWRLPGELKDPAGAAAGIQLDATGFNKVIAEADLPTFSAPYNAKQSAGGRNGETPPYSGPAALTGLFRCYFQSACSSGTGISASQIANRVGTPANIPVATVSAEVTPSITVADPTYYSDSHRANLYTFFQMESIYKTVRQRAAMPIAAPAYVGGGGPDTSDSCAIISLTKPQTRRIVRIQAERVGEWPQFPDPESMPYAVSTGVAIGQKCLKQKLLGGTVTKTCNGEDIYRATIEIVLALLRTPGPAEILDIGQNKWSTGSTKSNLTLTASSY